MLVLLRTERMQLRNYVDTQLVKRFEWQKGCATYLYSIKFGLLEVGENEISA